MTIDLKDWDEDLPPETPEEQYQTLVRSLRRRKGFGLLFVHCSPADGKLLVEKVRQDLPQKSIVALHFDEPINNLYDIVKRLPNPETINILFIEGLEHSFYKYETEKIQEGWGTSEVWGTQEFYQSQKGVPQILSHLNQHRERFRDDFNICFVFLLRSFAIKYFIRRAPDFFDWRSGELRIPLDQERLAQESAQIIQGGEYEKYLTLSPQEQAKKLLEIQEIIAEENQTPSDRAKLWFEQGLILAAAQDYQGSLLSFDQALKFQPDDHEAWNNRGNSLDELGRYEEAISSYDQACKFQPDYHEAWNNRGISLSNLGRYEEAISSYEQALKFQPDYHLAWNNRGISLSELGRNEEAISSYDQACKFQPDDHLAWYNRGISLGKLGRNEEAISSYEQALKFQPDDHLAWYGRGNSLDELGRNEEAISSYNQALKFQPDDHLAWYNRGISLRKLGRNEEAISSYEQALKFQPDDHLAWYNRGISLRKLGRNEEAISSYNQALKFQPDDDWYLYCIALAQKILGRIDETQASLSAAIELASINYDKNPQDWRNTFNLALYLMVKGEIEKAQSLYHEAINGAPVARIQEAVDDLNDLLVAFPNHPQALELRELLQSALS